MELEEFLQALCNGTTPFQAVFSSPQAKNVEVTKIALHPVSCLGEVLYQATSHYRTKTTHENYTLVEIKPFIQNLLSSKFKQALFNTSEVDYHVLVSSKGNVTILKKKPLKIVELKPHNRIKNTLLQENEPISFLIELGVMNRQGKVIAGKQDKFRQINRFLEMIADVIDVFDSSKPLHIIDFGCGKSYLTFALYHYLVLQQKRPVSMMGLDLKVEVIENCNKLAQKLGYTNLHFNRGDIAHFPLDRSVDMVVALHACDTATDAAIAQAIKWKAKVILAVPCCQHELFPQIKNKVLRPLLKHGILKERFAALATDAARANLLELAGYKTQVMEFIDMEHTPKNLLIRAVQTGKVSPFLTQEYQNFKAFLEFDCTLERLLKKKQ